MDLYVAHGGTVTAGDGAVDLVPPDVVRARRDGETREVWLPLLGENLRVHVWVRGDDVLFVGDETAPVWRARLSDLTMDEVARLDRLDFEGRYDPGGLHYVRVHDLDDGGVVVQYEAGVARLRRDGTLVWDRVHDDLSARVVAIDDVVWVDAAEDRWGYRLSDGNWCAGRRRAPGPP